MKDVSKEITTNTPAQGIVSESEALSSKTHVGSPQMARKRLVDFFDVLLEMHAEYKRNHKGIKNDKDPLLSLHLGTEAKNKRNP